MSDAAAPPSSPRGSEELETDAMSDAPAPVSSPPASEELETDAISDAPAPASRGPGSKEFDEALAFRNRVTAFAAKAKPFLELQAPEEKFRKWKAEDKPLNPHDTIRDEAQYDLEAAWSLALIGVLTNRLYKTCQEDLEFSLDDDEEASERDPHRHILNDYENGAPLMGLMLLTIHHDVLTAVVNGNMSSRCFEDEQFEGIVESYCRPVPHPLIYMNQIGRSKYYKGERQEWPGRFLSTLQYRELRSGLQKYATESLLGRGKSEWVTQVDNSVSDRNKTLPPTARCRWLLSKRARERLDVFIEAISVQYIEPGERLEKKAPNDLRLSLPFARSPQEYGWGRWGSDRMADHTHLKASNWLFSLCYCVVRELWPAERDRWQVFQFKIVNVPRPEYAQVAEYMCSEAGRSYWYQGGLNPTLAGTIPMKGERGILRPQFDKVFEGVQSDIVGLPYIQENIDLYRKQAAELADVNREIREKGPLRDRWAAFETEQKKLATDIEELQETAECNALDALIKRLDDILNNE